MFVKICPSRESQRFVFASSNIAPRVMPAVLLVVPWLNRPAGTAPLVSCEALRPVRNWPDPLVARRVATFVTALTKRGSVFVAMLVAGGSWPVGSVKELAVTFDANTPEPY
jgi:hypothetical protein